jgi:hypothetical protein
LAGPCTVLSFLRTGSPARESFELRLLGDLRQPTNMGSYHDGWSGSAGYSRGRVVFRTPRYQARRHPKVDVLAKATPKASDREHALPGLHSFFCWMVDEEEIELERVQGA